MTAPKLHPLTGRSLRPLGYRKSGAPIWPILGGSETAGDGTAGVTGDGAQGGDTGQQSAGQQAASQQAGEWDGKVESLPEPVQKMIRDLRTENGQRRTALTAAEQQQQDMVRALAKAAGVKLPDDEDNGPDPAALTQQLTAAQQAQRQTAVELAVYRTAGKHSGDPDALLDSRSFLNAVADLDPAAPDFGSQVDAAVKNAVDSNPKLKSGRVPGASGVDHTGGSGESTVRTPRSLTDAVTGHYGTA